MEELNKEQEWLADRLYFAFDDALLETKKKYPQLKYEALIAATNKWVKLVFSDIWEKAEALQRFEKNFEAVGRELAQDPEQNFNGELIKWLYDL